MQKLFRLVLLFTLVTGPLLAQRRQLGRVDIPVDKNTISVRVSGNTAELNGLSQQAFRSHGRYRLVTSDYSFDIRFSLVGATQVQVEIMSGRATTPMFSETVSGTSVRNALLRAADLAVAKTNGLGLRGFFTSRLAFIGEGSGKKEVYVSDLFLGEVRRITNDRADALSPRWSPDGSRLVYTSYYNQGFPDIYMLNLATNRRDVFARFKGTNTGARFSPNGSQVAMVLSGSGTAEIYVAPAAGGTPVRKTRIDSAKSSPCFSPDGSRIVFAMGDTIPQLYVIGAGGGSPQRLMTGFSYSAEPDWSRTNPNKIACTVKDGSRYQIAVYDFSEGRANVVSRAPFDGIEACWLPDGRHVVYTARDRNSSVLSILDTETGASMPLTERGPVGAAMQASVLFGQ